MFDHPPAAGSNRGSSRSLRLSLLLLLLISLLPLGWGILATLPQLGGASSSDGTAAAWRQVLAVIPGIQDARTSSAPVAHVADTGGVPPAPSAASRGADVNRVVYGDRLKVSFFESSGLTLDGSPSGSNPTSATAFLRMDLSGEYAVDESGAIDIPRLGQLVAAGQTVHGLQSALAARFRHAFGRSSDVHIAVVAREPVYVIGTVRSTGAVKYAPGMIVLQALANAGGTDSAIGDTSRSIERIRETERLHQEQDRLDRLQVKQAGLVALRDRSERLDLSPDIRSRLDDARIQGVLARAAVTLDLERKGREQQMALAEQRVHVAQLQVETEKFRITQLKELLNRKRQVLHDAKAIAARGSVSQFKIIEMGADLSTVEARQEDLQVALAQAQQNLLEAEARRARVQFDNSLQIQQQLATIAQEIEDSRRSIASMQAVIHVLQDDPATAASGRLNLTITRKTQGRFDTIPATAMTALMPGDVLQVGTGRPAEPAPSRAAKNSQYSKN